MAHHTGVLDQGTTSTRFIVFDSNGRIVCCAQKEHQQIYPQPGWVEHDPEEIWRAARDVMQETTAARGLTAPDFAAIGITNQRETTVVWNRKTGKLVKTGLPLSTYFSSLKIRWILDHVSGSREQAEAGDLLFGNIDTFLVWHLTGGPHGGIHVTDVTNASRTQLMNLETLAWDKELLDAFGIPEAMLPKICSSSEVYGEVKEGPLCGVPIAGILGDQQAALVGQACFRPGEAKNTYGTGCFLLMNTGERPVQSKCGLLTTVAFRFGGKPAHYALGGKPAHYALEGSIAITGALVQWLRDNLGLIGTSSEIETLARSVEDNGGVYFVPAFSGLYAPYWKHNARGVITGLTRYANKGHLARAVLEATAFQTREVVEAMEKDCGASLELLRVDGGMVENDLLMQFQADILNRPVVKSSINETTSLGAAYAAGLAVGFFKNTEDLCQKWTAAHTWSPNLDDDRRREMYRLWKKAVARSFDWID